MSKVIKSGEEMFQEICNKLSEITESLSIRQERLVSIASNLTSSENFTNETLQSLGEIEIQLRGKAEFAKLLDQHFSKQGSIIDFTLFSQEFNRICEFLRVSNELILKVQEQSSKESLLKEDIHIKISQIEKETQSNQSILQNKSTY
jgi:negative regulator of replication initiation